MILPALLAFAAGDVPCVAASGEVTLSEGTRLRESPDEAALSRALLDVEQPLPLLSRCGDWLEVRYGALRLFARPGDAGGPSTLRPGVEAAAPDAIPRADRLRTALGDPAGTLGPWALYADAPGRRLSASLRSAAESATEAFRLRTGVTPPPPKGEAVALVASADLYKALSGGDANAGHASNGVAVVRASGGTDSVRAVLRHELAHLLSQRTFRSGLPYWLEEGLADVASERLRPLADEEPDLGRLFAATRGSFTQAPARFYPLAGAVARLLLEPPRAARFHALLAKAASTGAPLTTAEVLTAWDPEEGRARLELEAALRMERLRRRAIPPPP